MQSVAGGTDRTDSRQALWTVSRAVATSQAGESWLISCRRARSSEAHSTGTTADLHPVVGGDAVGSLGAGRNRPGSTVLVMDLREQLAGDLDAAMRRVAAWSKNRDELRRALVETLSHLYAWREYEKRVFMSRTGKSIKGLAGTGAEHGLWVEALLLWRIVAEHHPEQLVELRVVPLFPGPRTFLSEWLFLGANLCLVNWDEIPERIRMSRTPQSEFFRDQLAGQPILPAFGVAARCLKSVNTAP
jgi:hypothetical protein